MTDDLDLEESDVPEEHRDKRGNRQYFNVLRMMKELEHKLDEYLAKGANDVQANRN